MCSLMLVFVMLDPTDGTGRLQYWVVELLKALMSSYIIFPGPCNTGGCDFGDQGSKGGSGIKRVIRGI